MPKDPKATEESDQDVSRRGLLEKVALIVGVATSAVATRGALARSADIVMDSAGRVLIDGATVSTQSPDGSFEEARTIKLPPLPRTPTIVSCGPQRLPPLNPAPPKKSGTVVKAPAGPKKR